MGQADVLIMVFLALTGAFFWLRIRRRQSVPKSNLGKRVKYHCIEVRSDDGACEAVKRLAIFRFLPDEAPRLPVPGCDAKECACRYRHYDDRRQEIRRHPYGQMNRLPPAESGERRTRSDRRSPQLAFDL